MEEIKKRPNPFEKKINEMSEVVEENTNEPVKKAPTKKTTSTSASKKAPSSKKPATTKKPTTKPKIDPKTGIYKQPTKATNTEKKPKAPTKKAPTKAPVKKPSTPKKTTVKKAILPVEPSTVDDLSINGATVEPVVEPVIEQTENKQPTIITNEIEPTLSPITPKKPGRQPKPKLPKKDAKSLTIEPAPRQPEPPVLRPQPKKAKALTKEEKVLYKKLEETFNYVANLTWVIEERTMDQKNIPDLTLGELHVIEMVNQYNNKPMTLIANKLKVTVGSLTIGVNRLVQKEYLLRIRDEMDHRVILLSVTSKGKKVLKFHDKFHEDILGLILEGVSLQQTVKVFTQTANMLEYYYDPKSYEQALSKEKKKK